MQDWQGGIHQIQCEAWSSQWGWFESTFLGLTIPQNDSVMFGSLSGEELVGVEVGRKYEVQSEQGVEVDAKIAKHYCGKIDDEVGDEQVSCNRRNVLHK